MAPETADVVIVVAHKDDKPDHTRIGHRETWPYPTARTMVETGEARWLDDPRNADDQWPIDDRPKDTPAPPQTAHWTPGDLDLDNPSADAEPE